MLIKYFGKCYSNTICSNCYADIRGELLPPDADIYVDGMPVGYEKAFLEECVTYCPKCGQIVINAPHLHGINKILSTDKDLTKKTVLDAVYKQYANDYVMSLYQEYCGDMTQAPVYLRAFINKEAPLDRLSQLTVWQKIEYADIYRRLGEFNTAMDILKSIGSKIALDELCRYMCKTELKASQKKNKERIVIPRNLNIMIM